MKRGLWASAAVVAIAASAAVGWQQSARSPKAHWIATNDPAILAEGREVYDGYCASCHGAKLEGQSDWMRRLPSGRMPAPPHDETGHTWHHPSAALFDIVREGVQKYAPAGYESDMPAFGATLSDEQIRAVLSYIRSSWPVGVKRRHAEIEARNR